MKSTKELHMVAFLLAMIGALNWGLVGLLNFNLVEMLLGSMPVLMKLVYILVGAGAVYILATHQTDCKYCSSAGKKK
ncbi:DUF378 domain-containing protein [Candidatus Roizmanbacteria bacterium]|nr:DUF378 domain-containing protein [Candidatus Roizmanbacteria bacterium]